MALQCDYTTPQGHTLTSAYCKIVALSLNEYANGTGDRNGIITVGIWPSAASRQDNPRPMYEWSINIANGYYIDTSLPFGSEGAEQLINEYDRVFGTEALSGDGANPVKAAYDEIKTLTTFSTNLVDV